MSSAISVEQAFDKVHVASLLDALTDLYADMDRAYETVADKYDFVCTGCVENCCLTRFYHHTFLEFIYLRKGFSKLESAVQQAVRERARSYLAALTTFSEKSAGGAYFQKMCPLNQSGMCILYVYRPMICRLHGIPHELAPPGQPKVMFGQGCSAFAARCGDKPYYRFDRTPFYTRMSTLEAEFRKVCGISARSKKTVAHMLIEEEVPIG